VGGAVLKKLTVRGNTKKGELEEFNQELKQKLLKKGGKRTRGSECGSSERQRKGGAGAAV